MTLPPSLWDIISTAASYAFLALLQVLWWLDHRQLRMHMAERIRASGVILGDVIRREAGTRPPNR